jgi:N-acetylgalactosamine 4-sulfate 6-O-sulfotransferase
MYIPQKVKKLLWYKSGSLTDNEASYAMSQLFMVKDKTDQKAKVPKSLVCIPGVYFIGFPKSGSSQLFQLMKRNPEIVTGINKEPHWWTRVPFNAKFPHNILAIFRYLMHFQDASHHIASDTPHALAIDASQSTVWDTRETKNACILPSLVHSMVPTAKYIVMMRDPVDRLYSDFTFLCEKRWETQKLKSIPDDYLQNGPELFHRTAKLEIEEFEECLLNHRLQVCTHRALYGRESVTNNVCGRVRLGISLYHVHIAQWLKVIPRHQFLFLRTEDLATDSYKLINEVWNFLNLPSQPREELEDVLNSRTNYSPVAHMKALQLQPKTREMLEKFYSSHDLELAKMLNNDAFLWRDSREQRLLKEEEEEREMDEAVQAMESQGDETVEY